MKKESQLTCLPETPSMAPVSLPIHVRRLIMAKVLRCNDLMPGCPFEARGDSEESILAQAAEHAKTAHNLSDIPEEMISKVRGAIHEDDQASAQKAGS
jgi:predicted small metal-binding protein